MDDRGITFRTKDGKTATLSPDAFLLSRAIFVGDLLTIFVGGGAPEGAGRPGGDPASTEFVGS